jgi:hypothetical protein
MPSVPDKKGKLGSFPSRHSGAGNEARTRDLNLGKVALYQLSYSRMAPDGTLPLLTRLVSLAVNAVFQPRSQRNREAKIIGGFLGFPQVTVQFLQSDLRACRNTSQETKGRSRVS